MAGPGTPQVGEFVEYDTGTVAGLNHAATRAAEDLLRDPRAPVVQAGPGVAELIGSHFQNSTSVGSLMANKAWRTFSTPDAVPMTPEDIQLQMDEDGIDGRYRHAFKSVRDDEMYQAVLADVKAARERHEVMAQYGMAANFAAGLAANLADPVNLVPVAGQASKLKTLGTAAVQGARAGAIGAALTEGVVQFADPVKTKEESALDVVVGGAFGAVLGVGLHAIVSAPKAREIETRMRDFVRKTDEDIAAELRKNAETDTGFTPPKRDVLAEPSRAPDGRTIEERLAEQTQRQINDLNDRLDARAFEFEQDLTEAFPPREATPEPPEPSSTGLTEAGGGMAKGIGEGLRDMLWTRYQDGELTGSNGSREAVLQAAKLIEESGGRKLARDEFEALLKDYGDNVVARRSEMTAPEYQTVMRELVVRNTPRELEAAGSGNPASLSAADVAKYNDEDVIDDRLFGVYSPSGVMRAYGKAVSIMRNPRLEMMRATSRTLRNVLDRLDSNPYITGADRANMVRNQTNVHGAYREIEAEHGKAQQLAEELWWANRAKYKNQDDFGTRIYMAVINDGKAADGDPIIEQAAKAYNAYFDHVLKKYQDAGLLKEGVDLANAEAYAPYVHLIENIRRDSGKFIEAHKNAFREVMLEDCKALETKRINDTQLKVATVESKRELDDALATLDKEYGKTENSRTGKFSEKAKEVRLDRDAAIDRAKEDARTKLEREDDLLRRKEITKEEHAVQTRLIRERRDVEIKDIQKATPGKLKDELKKLSEEKASKAAEAQSKHEANLEKVRASLPEWDKYLLAKLGQNRNTAVERADTLAELQANSYYDGATKNNVVTGHDLPMQHGLPNVLRARKGKVLQQVAAENGWVETNIFRLTEAYNRRAGMDAAIANVFKKIRYEGADGERLTPSQYAKLSEAKRKGGTWKPVEVGDVDLSSVKEQIETEYKGYIDRARDAGKGDLEEALVKERNRQMDNLNTLLELLRGRHEHNVMSGNTKAVADGVLMFNAWRHMGGVLVSSLMDPINIVIANGLGKSLRHGILPAIRNFRAAMGKNPMVLDFQGKPIAAEDLPEIYRVNRLMGIVMEHQHNSRIGAMADLGADIPSGKVSRLMHVINKNFWDYTGITYWTNFAKNAAAGVTHARFVMAANEGFDAQTPGTRAWLTNLKLGADDLHKIKAAWEAQPKKNSLGVPYMALDEWADRELANRVANALRREVDNEIVTPNAGDKLALQNTPVGRFVWQFRSYGLGHSAKVVSRNASLGNMDGNHKATFYTGLVMLSLGAVVVDALKAIAADSTLSGQSRDGRPDVLARWADKWEKTPAEALYNVLDRSGTFWLLTEPSNIAQKLGLPNFQGAASIAFGDEKEARQGSSRFANRSPFDAALGPTASLLTDTAALSAVLSGGIGHALGLVDESSLSRSDFLRAKRLIPFNNMVGPQQAINSLHSQFGTIFDWPEPN